MGTNKFQSDYIQYLQECNSNLHDKLMKMKELENRVLNNEFRNRHSEMVLKEITGVCDSACEAIDNLFENFTATMNSLKNVLMWKSQISQIPNKLSFAMKSGTHSCNLMPLVSESLSESTPPVNEIPETRSSKKCETAKVSPMIKGHVISTPRIHLNRVSKDVGLLPSRTFGTVLSPIMEASPNASPSAAESPRFREVRIPLRRLQLSHYTGRNSKTEGSGRENASPRLNIMKNKPGFKFRQRCPLESRDQFQVGTVFPEAERESGTNRLESVAERNGNEEAQNGEYRDKSPEKSQRSPEEMDPIEGPSWLLDGQRRSQPDRSPDLHDYHYSSVNFKRGNHSSFNRSATDEEKKKEILNINDNAQMGNFETFGSGEETRGTVLNLEKERDERYLSEGGETESSLFEEPSGDSRDEDSISAEDERNAAREPEDAVLRPRRSFGDVFRNRTSEKLMRASELSPVLSGRKSTPGRNQSQERFSHGNNNNNNNSSNCAAFASPSCSVLLRRISLDSSRQREYMQSLESKAESPVRRSTPVLTRSSSRCSKRDSKSEDKKAGTNDSTPFKTRTPVRAKRRAAELCSQRINWINVKAQENSPSIKIKPKRLKRKNKKQTKIKKC